VKNRKELDKQFLFERFDPSSTYIKPGHKREEQVKSVQECLPPYINRSAEKPEPKAPPVSACSSPVSAKKYHFADLVDISLIQKLLNECYSITGVTNALLDVDNKILSSVGWQGICDDFHRTCPGTAKRCQQSDSYIFDHLQDGTYVGYKCMNGLVDYAVPIIVEGQHLATIYAGQCLHERPDNKYFRQQAREHGFDETEYMKALEQVPIISEERMENIMNFYSQLVQVIATMGLERRRQIESAEGKFVKAFHCCPDPITISTLEDGSYVEVNEAWVESTGFERHEVIGRTGSELGIWMTPYKRDLLINSIRESGSVHSIETAFQTKFGEVLSYLTSADFLEINGTDYLLCIHKDISDRKRMEEKLHLSEECFSKAFNASPIIMCINSLEEDMVIDVNHQFCQVLGFTREEVLGQTLTALGFWLDVTERQLITSMIKKKQSVRDMEIHFATKSGEPRLGEYSAERIDVAGQACMLSLLIDITDKRQMEIEMNRLDRLNLVGEMAASIGHEIRNPMTTVRGFLQMLQAQHNFMDDNETLELMIDELDRANAIITEFLSLAKHKLSKLEYTDLNVVIKNMLPLLSVHALPQEKSVNIELADAAWVLADEKEIRQLLLNLVRNGLEAMHPGGILTIRTAMEEEYIVLSIEDQGEGIAPQILDKLGTPFLSTKENGTGLGLAVCYGIAKRHNASINIQTGLQGTTFQIKFNGMFQYVLSQKILF